MPIVLFAFVFAEIAILLRLGLVIGAGWVFAEVLLTVVIGLLVLRRAGPASLRTDEVIRMMIRPGDYLRRPEWTGIIVGILLVVPGILTDVAALVLAIRRAGGGAASTREAPGGGREDVIDVEYRVHDDPES